MSQFTDTKPANNITIIDATLNLFKNDEKHEQRDFTTLHSNSNVNV